jgi:hypothetical protein
MPVTVGSEMPPYSRDANKNLPSFRNVTTVDSHAIDETVIDGYDVAQFYSLPEIYGFPFEVWSNIKSDNKSGLSLGPNSSFIDTLLYTELIPSGAFGLFFWKPFSDAGC